MWNKESQQIHILTTEKRIKFQIRFISETPEETQNSIKMAKIEQSKESNERGGGGILGDWIVKR